MQIINQYVIANEARLKNLCKRMYHGNDLWQDLFQEFYIDVVNVNDNLFNRYSLKQLCYWRIVTVYKNRQRYDSLKHFNTTDLIEERGEEIPYITDIEEFIDAELNKPHGFAPMLVFMQSLDEPLREISRKTSINVRFLSEYKREAQKKLQDFCK